MSYIYTMEYCAAFKKGDPAMCDNAVNLGDIMLSEISQTQKDK
jgi:hypothetical protein